MVVVLLLSGTGLETGGGDDLGKTPSLYRLFSLRISVDGQRVAIYTEHKTLGRLLYYKFHYFLRVCASLYAIPSTSAILLPRFHGGCVNGIVFCYSITTNFFDILG
jgi:hypothetical protein